MDISGSNLNQPVSFYQKNTGNNINYPISGNNHLYTSNVFIQETQAQSLIANNILKPKKRSKSKRLNTVDSDYLPDDTEIALTQENQDNFFVTKKDSNSIEKLFKFLNLFIKNTPLINYFFLKDKEKNIKKTVNTLYDISQNVDELMNTAVPYGEETELYNNIAMNLTKAANIIGETNKKNW